MAKKTEAQIKAAKARARKAKADKLAAAGAFRKPRVIKKGKKSGTA